MLADVIAAPSSLFSSCGGCLGCGWIWLVCPGLSLGAGDGRARTSAGRSLVRVLLAAGDGDAEIPDHTGDERAADHLGRPVQLRVVEHGDPASAHRIGARNDHFGEDLDDARLIFTAGAAAELE